MGKGRDMGFISINGFEIKISGGNGEVCVSRDLYRVATRVDFFRMMSVYYSGPGFFINNAILMTTVYLQTWVLVVLALAGSYLISSGNLQESEGIVSDESPAPGEEEVTGRRLLMDVADRHLLQDYGTYDVGATVEEPPEDDPADDAATATEVFDQDSYTSQYYADFNNVEPDDGGGGGGGATYADEAAQDYYDGYLDQATLDDDVRSAPSASARVPVRAPLVIEN